MDNIVLYDILVGSMSVALSKVKSTGKLDVYDLHLLTIFGKLLNDFNSTITLTDRNTLEESIRLLQNKNSYICNYKNISGVTINNVINVKPVVTNLAIEVDDLSRFFTFEDFTSTFTDVNGDLPDKIRINTLPTEGNLTLNGNAVLVNDEFTSSTITSLLYTWTDYTTQTDALVFQVSDNNINNPLFSDMTTMTININATVNLPPSQTGVLTLNIDNSSTHIFTQANFTTETVPVYLDPEGDNANNIKITQLTTNGVLQKNGIPVNTNDNISFVDINAGNFAYVTNAADQTLHVDTFNFSISDEGSDQFTPGGSGVINVAAYVNQAPTTGDGSTNVDEGSILTFTREMFTSSTTPPYADPEGDVATNWRAATLPATGLIKLNNVNINALQVITFADIDLGLLTYVQAVSAGGTMPAFNFNIQDSEGNWSS